MAGSHVPLAFSRAALFVDFDNVFSSLLSVNRQAALRFAHDPGLWVRWFEAGSHDPADADGDELPRRLLVRRCYLNPAIYGNARAAFTRSGFSVIDCPSLTSQGKSSADIYMVMDIMDTLNHRTVIDEFIILSSDADFTPVLLRLREHDRRSTIIANAVAASALKAASDIAVNQNEFIEEALGIEEAAKANRPGIAVQRTVTSPRTKASNGGQTTDERASVLNFVREALQRAKGPVFLGPLGGNIRRHLGARIIESNWDGCGSLTQLLQSLEREGEFQVVPSGSKSYIFDPKIHSPLPFEELDHLVGIQSAFAQFIDRMSKSIAIPRFSPAAYSVIFREVARALGHDFENQSELTNRIIEQCHNAGIGISRQTIDFVLAALVDVGLDLSASTRDPHTIAEKFKENVLNLCRNAQIVLSDDDLSMVDAWLLDNVTGNYSSHAKA